MRYRIILSFLLLLLFSGARGDTFMVTSNADAGSGSFREALTLAAANGTGVKDYIHFNLSGSSLAERTIMLKAELPLVSSNLVIDASTQPGLALGTSTAKIMLDVDLSVYRASSYEMGGLNILAAHDVEIYGFCFNNFRDFTVWTSAQSSDPGAIYIAESSNVTVGAPGKGNVFMENEIGVNCRSVYNFVRATKIKVQSNWFGLNTAGVPAGNRRYQHVSLSGDEIVFGGDIPDKGNVLGGFTHRGTFVGGSKCTVRFNRFGYNGDGTFNERMVDVSLTVTDSEFSDNVATHFNFDLYYCKNLKLLRNREEQNDNMIYYNRLEVTSCDGIQIGDDDLANANTFLETSYQIYNGLSTNVEVRKNIIHCNDYTYFIRDTKAVTINLLVSSDTEFSGTATPNSDVYIYNDYSACSSCSPLQFFTQVIADASGNWKITGDFSNKRLIANATLVKNSSEFTQPQIRSGSSGYWYINRDPSCGQSNGSLEIVNYFHLLKIEWFNKDNVKVGEGAKVEGLPPGRYYVKGSNGKCYVKTELIDLMNAEPAFVDRNLRKQQPSCSRRNGSIKGIYYTLPGGGQVSIKWVDENNIVVGTGLDLENMGPGVYTLFVTTNSGCTKSYGPVQLSNTDGPNILLSPVVVTDSNCGTKEGSIIGVAATGTGRLEFSWKDQQGTVVGQAADLKDVASGIYVLSVKDESGCDPVTRSYEVKELNGIIMDLSGATFTKSTCAGNNGGIRGIVVGGATTYEWMDVDDRLVSGSLDLSGVGPGKYRLRASNATCERISQLLTIELAPNLISIGRVDGLLAKANCGLNNGSIELRLINASVSPIAYRWENERGQTLPGATSKQINLDAGTYRIYGIDNNNCEIFLVSYILDRIPEMKVEQAGVSIIADRCQQQIGGISGLRIGGGLGPYVYRWHNTAGQEVSTEANLRNVSSGNYKLIVTDATGCEISSAFINVPNQNMTLLAPMAEDVRLCSKGSTLIVVKSPKEGASYQLYESDDVISPIAISSGIFRIDVSENRSCYLSEKIGSCESSRREVKVAIGISSFNLMNTITPNGDHINDLWKINGIENYPSAVVQLFSRSGAKVYESKGYKTPFDGTVNGNVLPGGVYYYIINFGAGCPNLSGSLTIVR